MKLTENNRYTLLMSWFDLRGQRLKIKVKTGRRGDEGIHVDIGVLTSIFWFSMHSIHGVKIMYHSLRVL